MSSIRIFSDIPGSVTDTEDGYYINNIKYDLNFNIIDSTPIKMFTGHDRPTLTGFSVPTTRGYEDPPYTLDTNIFTSKVGITKGRRFYISKSGGAKLFEMFPDNSSTQLSSFRGVVGNYGFIICESVSTIYVGLAPGPESQWSFKFDLIKVSKTALTAGSNIGGGQNYDSTPIRRLTTSGQFIYFYAWGGITSIDTVNGTESTVSISYSNPSISKIVRDWTTSNQSLNYLVANSKIYCSVYDYPLSHVSSTQNSRITECTIQAGIPSLIAPATLDALQLQYVEQVDIAGQKYLITTCTKRALSDIRYLPNVAIFSINSPTNLTLKQWKEFPLTSSILVDVANRRIAEITQNWINIYYIQDNLNLSVVSVIPFNIKDYPINRISLDSRSNLWIHGTNNIEIYRLDSSYSIKIAPVNPEITLTGSSTQSFNITINSPTGIKLDRTLTLEAVGAVFTDGKTTRTITTSQGSATVDVVITKPGSIMLKVV